MKTLSESRKKVLHELRNFYIRKYRSNNSTSFRAYQCIRLYMTGIDTDLNRCTEMWHVLHYCRLDQQFNMVRINQINQKLHISEKLKDMPP